MSCEFASLRTNIERTLERTGHLVAGIAGEIEGDVILFAVTGHGYRTAGDAGIARYGIVFHADIPGTARECRVGVAPASGRNIAWLELVCRVVFGGGYGIGTVGEVVFVVVVLLYRFGIEVDAKFVARSGEIPLEVVFDSLIPEDKVPGSFRFVAVVVVDIQHGLISATAEHLVGNHIYLDKVSVGATINIMMAASMAEGKTIIENAAKEPHVVDVANFLNSMGANIRGAGTDVIRIVGVEKLHKTEYSIIPDQIEAGTFMFAAAATKGDVTVKNVIPKHLEATTAKLIEIGCEVEEFDDAVRVVSSKPLHHTQVTTLPYPGFPTDMQPQMSVLLALAEGTSTVTESIFENRFKYVDELTRMGAQVKVESNIAIITGVEKFTGARVSAPDLRAGAALVIAGLAAEGITIVDDIYYIERGYEHFEEKLASLGAMIEKVSSEKEIQKFTLKVS